MFQEAERRLLRMFQKVKGRLYMKWYQLAGGILAACVLCGCSGGTQEVKQTNKSLTLCVDRLVNDTYAKGFEEFKKTYPQVELNVEVYEDLLAGAEQINTQIMAGEGPDLMLMTNYSTSDVYKMMKAQAFAPLDEFMKQDKGWNADLYAKAVLDAGIHEGKQMVMPLSYTVKTALTSEENLAAAGISLDDCNNMESFLQEIAKFYDLDDAERVLGDVGQLADFPGYLSGQFLDYSKGTLGVDEQILERACTAYRSFYQDDFAATSGLMPDTGFPGVGEAIANGETCMVITFSGNSFMEAAQAVAANASPVLWPFRNVDGQVCASVIDYAGIRANSENKQNAWNLLKILMGDATQTQIADIGSYYPVLKPVLEEETDRIREEAYETGKKLVETEPLSQELQEQYEDAVMNPQKALFMTDVCSSKFVSCMRPFYEEGKNYEDCIGEFRKCQS